MEFSNNYLKDSSTAVNSDEYEEFGQADSRGELQPTESEQQLGIGQQHDFGKKFIFLSGGNTLEASIGSLQYSTEQTFSQGCQSGVVGTRDFKGTKHAFPKEYRVTFKPPFKTTPHLVYGITLLEANSYTYVDVFTYYFTRDQVLFSMKTSSSYNSYLRGVQISWMACP